MAQGNTPDIRVLVDVEGGASIDGASAQQITKTLAAIAKNISVQKTPVVTFGVDYQKTAKKIYKQLSEITESIKLKPISLNIQTIQASNENIAYIDEKQVLGDLSKLKSKDVEVTKQQGNENRKAAKEIRKLTAEFERLGNVQKSLNTAENYANKLGKTDLLAKIPTLRNELGPLTKDVDKFLSDIGGLDNLGNHINDDSFVDLAKRIKDCNSAISELKQVATEDNPLFVKNERIAENARDVSDFALSLGKFEKVNDKFKGNAGLATEFDRIKAALEDIKRRASLGEDISIDLDNLKKRTNDWKASLDAAGLSGQTAFGKLRTQLEKLGVYFSASAIMMGTWRQIKNMTNNVIELDTAMTELKKVTDETDASYSKFLNNAEVRAKRLGATLTDTIRSTADAARMDYSLNEAESLADTFNIYKNVGD